MKRFRNIRESGFTIMEVMVVIAIVGLLASIALPNYLAYREKALAIGCQSNRIQAETDEVAYNMAKGVAGLVINENIRCPSGGVLVWVVSDPDDPEYPKLGCSVHGFPSNTVGSATDTLFTTTFDDMEGLVQLMGKWVTNDGALVPTGSGEQRLAFGDEDWNDYTLEMNATLTEGNGYGIYYRSDGEAAITGYCFQYDPGYGSGEFLVRKVNDGRESGPIQRVKIPDGFSRYNTSHEISISVEGEQTTIQVDGEEIFNFTDDSYETGSAGLRTWSNSDVMFEDISVTADDD